MVVHLIKTPEYSNENRNNVFQLLQGTGVGLQFLEANWEGIDEEGLPPFFSFEDIWVLCNNYREENQVADDDFVVLLTSIPNVNNYFSYFDEGLNAFVHTGDWEYFGIGNSAYPIAYEVAANILQRLMGLDDNHIHFDSPIGCMNDMCEVKNEILLKLRTADICPECLEEMDSQGVDEDIIFQVLDIFEKVRTELMWAQGFRGKVRRKNLEITTKGEIRIGGALIKLNPMNRMLMIFFLRHLDGIFLRQLDEFQDELLAIYKGVGGRGEEKALEKRIREFVSPLGEYKAFSSTKNRLHDELSQGLGNLPSKHYLLVREAVELIPREREFKFKIDLAPELITDNFQV